MPTSDAVAPSTIAKHTWNRSHSIPTSHYHARPLPHRATDRSSTDGYRTTPGVENAAVTFAGILLW